MVDVPAAMPVTTPEVEPTVATAVLALLHVPPATESVSVMVDPEQRVLGPLTYCIRYRGDTRCITNYNTY
jgi:hypothetical protein